MGLFSVSGMRKGILIMMKKIFCGLMAAVLLIGLQAPVPVEAAGKFVFSETQDSSVKVKGAVFTAERYLTGPGYSKIIRKKDGKSTTILSGVDAGFATDGDVLYYSKPVKQINSFSWKNTVYCYNIKLKKSRKIVSGRDFVVQGCSGRYLYCGNNNGADGVNLYAVNVKTKKKKHMVNTVGKVVVSDGKVLTTTNSGALGNYPIHVFNLNGSGKKKIAEGCHATIKKGKIYYARWNMKTNKFKVYRCSLKGNNKKAVTKWLSRTPSKYF